MWNENRHPGFPMSSTPEDFSSYCRVIPNFPKKGVDFRDITTLLKNGPVFKRAIDTLVWNIRGKADLVVCAEARGFLLGGAIANTLELGLVPVRKKGKLPYRTKSRNYKLEYGTDSLEIHEDSIQLGQRVLLVDDILATGGTAKAVLDLVLDLGGKVEAALFLGEIVSLKGREKFNIPVYSLIQF